MVCNVNYPCKTLRVKSVNVMPSPFSQIQFCCYNMWSQRAANSSVFEVMILHEGKKNP